jgi:hypothetical protein
MSLDLNSSQTSSGCLIFGIFLCCLGAVWIYMDKAWLRFGGWVYRAKEPKWFWSQVAVHFLLGLGFICVYLYLTN